MAIQTAQGKENLAVAYGDAADFAALYTTAPGATAGTEVTGGGYARQPLTWAPGTVDGVVTATATFNVPAGVTVRGGGVHTLVTGGVYLDGATLPDQAFGSAGTYTLTLTFTQS